MKDYREKVKLAITAHRCGVGNVDFYVDVNDHNVTCDRMTSRAAIAGG